MVMLKILQGRWEKNSLLLAAESTPFSIRRPLKQEQTNFVQKNLTKKKQKLNQQKKNTFYVCEKQSLYIVTLFKEAEIIIQLIYLH